MAICYICILFLLRMLFSTFIYHCFLISENPKFSEPITNVTVAVGREAILACQVEDLGQYKVSKFSKQAEKCHLKLYD